MKRIPPHPFLAIGAIGLLAGLWGGLVRLGVPLPPGRASWILAHGPLMVCAFLGTLISVERAVALGRPIGWLVPALAGAATLGMVAVGFGFPAPVLFVIGSLGLAVVLGALALRRPDFAGALLVVGALAWAVGNWLWAAGWALPLVAPWWIGFLVLTIAGERLELSRLRRPSRRSQALFAGIVAVLAASLGLGLAAPGVAFRAMGLALFVLAIWLLVNDMARVSVKASGVTRFTAVCLLGGFGWLAVGGLGALIRGNEMAGPGYDAVLHAIFVGFVFSMIFGHAPIVFPAVLGRSIAFNHAVWVPLIFLHVSLALRVGSDLGGWTVGRMGGGVVNALSIVAYLGLTARSLRRRP